MNGGLDLSRNTSLPIKMALLWVGKMGLQDLRVTITVVLDQTMYKEERFQRHT